MGGITRGIANRLGAGGVGTNFRNILINGDMSVDQRGSATGLTADNIGNGADRFYVRVNARTNYAFSMENSTDVPSGEGFSNSHKITTTTAETSLGAAGILRYGQRIEGNMLKGLKYGTTNAQKIVVQFWVKCSVTGTFVFELWNRKSSWYNSKSFTIDSANTWQKIIKTFDGDTVNDFNIDNSVQLEANIWWAAGTSFSSSGTVTGGDWNSDATKRAGGLSNAFTTTLNATFFTTGWQLEVGTSTSAFERLPIDVNLQRCQRYYEKNYDLATAPAGGSNYTNTQACMIGTAFSTSNIRIYTEFKVRKRTTPTATFYYVTGLASGSNAGKWDVYLSSGWTQTSGNTSSGEIDEQGININLNHSGFTFGESYLTGGGWSADAEL